MLPAVSTTTAAALALALAVVCCTAGVLITSRTNIYRSFSGGADYPTYWVSIPVGRIV